MFTVTHHTKERRDFYRDSPYEGDETDTNTNIVTHHAIQERYKGDEADASKKGASPHPVFISFNWP